MSTNSTGFSFPSSSSFFLLSLLLFILRFLLLSFLSFLLPFLFPFALHPISSPLPFSLSYPLLCLWPLPFSFFLLILLLFSSPLFLPSSTFLVFLYFIFNLIVFSNSRWRSGLMHADISYNFILIKFVF